MWEGGGPFQEVQYFLFITENMRMDERDIMRGKETPRNTEGIMGTIGRFTIKSVVFID